MRNDGIDCLYYQINNRIFKQGKNVSNLCYSLFSFTFIFLLTIALYRYQA